MCSLTIIFYYCYFCYLCIDVNDSKSKNNGIIPAQNNDKKLLMSSTTKSFHNTVRSLFLL